MVRTEHMVVIAFIVIATFLYTQTGGFIQGDTADAISSAFFPRFIIISLIICCMWLIIKSKVPKVSFPEPASVAIGAGMVVAYVLLINWLGCLIATSLLLFIMPAFLGYRNWRWLIGLSLGGTLFTYFVFYKILGVPLPLGILENMGVIL